MSLSLEKFLERIPKEYRSNVVLLETFRGNRTKVAFTFSCGCTVEQLLKTLLRRDNFDACNKCKDKNDTIYTCKYCLTNFKKFSNFEKCSISCEEKYKNLIINEDYVVCSICKYHAKSLGTHVRKIHGIQINEYKKR